MNRLIVAALAIAVVVALALSVATYRSVSEAQLAQALTSVQIVESIAIELDNQIALRRELGQQPFAVDGTGALQAYLAKIRRDGLPAHAEMRKKLGSISRSNTSILTLLDLYEPYAKTANFKKEVSTFRAYAPAWNDRWDSVMEYFMAGGNMPSSDVPFAAGFAAAIQAEMNAAK